MKLSLEEIIEMVKEELLCYEDMEKIAEQWEKEFRQWVKQNNKNNYMNIKDEEEIFEIADSYRDAIEQNTIAAYWKQF